MKVGFVFDDSLDRNDGVQQYIKTLGRWLMKNDHEVRYLVGQTSEAGEFQPYVYSLSKNIDVRGNKNRLTIPLPAKSSEIRKVLAREDFDILHVQAPYSPMMAGKVIKNAHPRTAVLATFHIVGDSWRENLGISLLSLASRSSMSRIDKHLAVSEAAVEASRSYFPKTAEVSPNVVELNRFRSALKTNRANKIVYLGRLVQRKGIMHLLEAINLLNQNNKLGDHHLLIAGDGPDRAKAESFVDEYNLRDKVAFLGFIAEEAKPELLGDADLAVFPSTGGESFGIVLIEAMAAGALTIGGDNVGYRSVLNGSPETIVDVFDTRKFATMINAYLTDAKLKGAAYKWQSKRVKQFDVDIVGKELLEHYRSAIVKRQALENIAR